MSSPKRAPPSPLASPVSLECGGEDSQCNGGHDPVTSTDSSSPFISESSTGELTDKQLIKSRRNIAHGIENWQALINLIKGLIGTGILALPIAFKNAGLWLGFAMTIVIALIAVHCMNILVHCSRHLCKKYRKSFLDYADIVELAVSNGPKPFQRFSSAARILVNVFIFITQLGFCCVYVVFISDNIKQIVDHNTPEESHLSVQLYIMMFFVPIVLLCSIRQLRWLSPFSAISNLLFAIGFIITFQYLFRDLKPTWSLPAVAPDFLTIPLFFGTVMFAFEGICLVLPIENKMYHPDQFTGVFGVLNTGCLIVVCIYIAMGFFGYLCFGDEIKDSITLSLPKENPLYQSVNVILAVAVYFTYAVQFYVPMQVVAAWVAKRFDAIAHPRRALWIEFAVKILLILLTFLLAELIPHLSLFISLVGAFAGAALAMIFPPMIELVAYDSWGRFNWVLVKNVFICAFGTLGFLTGTYSAVRDIVTTFTSGHSNGHVGHG